jgi:hypothetical protein
MGKMINADNIDSEHKTIAETFLLVISIFKTAGIFKLYSSYKFITKEKFKIKLSA